MKGPLISPNILVCQNSGGDGGSGGDGDGDGNGGYSGVVASV